MENQTQAVEQAVKSNPFDGTFKLAHSVAVYVPSTINANESHDTGAIVDDVAVKLSNLFGGSTITDGTGTWVSAEHGLIKESVKIVRAFCTDVNYEAVYDIAVQIKNDLRQESVGVEIDGQFYLV